MQWCAPASGKRGRQRIFSEAAVQFCLSIKCLFNLALRQSLGTVESLLRLAGLDWSVPDFSTVYRRQWRKVHLGIDAQTLGIRAIEVTDNSVEDGAGGAPMRPELLAQLPPDEALASVSADGAYDTKACHAAIVQRGAQAVVPPRKNGTPWKAALVGASVRNEALKACQPAGVRHLHAVERLPPPKLGCRPRCTAKRLGERVMARTFERQVVELHVRVALLNRFTQLGRPTTVPVVAMA